MMDLKDKIALITGASAGIGASCARVLASAGARVILTARRGDRLDRLAKELGSDGADRCLPLVLDVRDRAAVDGAIASLSPRWAGISILVNNAGLGRGLDKVHEGDPAEWDEMLDTNVKGLLYVSRAVLPGMVARGSGHVVNIGSVAGRETYPGGNVYCAPKFAVKALTRAMRMDLMGTPLRVTTVDPGMVETEFSVVRFRGDAQRAAKVYQDIKALTPDDIADAVLWAVTRPSHVDVTEMVLMPTAQASAMLNHRGPLDV